MDQGQFVVKNFQLEGERNSAVLKICCPNSARSKILLELPCCYSRFVHAKRPFVEPRMGSTSLQRNFFRDGGDFACKKALCDFGKRCGLPRFAKLELRQHVSSQAGAWERGAIAPFFLRIAINAALEMPNFGKLSPASLPVGFLTNNAGPRARSLRPRFRIPAGLGGIGHPSVRRGSRRRDRGTARRC